MRSRLIVPAIVMMAVLSSCGPRITRTVVADEPVDGGLYSEKTVPVVYKVIPDGEVTLRFYDSLPDVAYISPLISSRLSFPDQLWK